MFKVATLNIWCYFDWENRKEKLVSLLRDQSPDFVALQEAQTNHAFSYLPQSDFVADACDLRYRIFAPTYKRDGQIDKEGGYTQETSFGLAFLSRYPIISSETYFLKQHPEHDEACSVLFVIIENDGVEIEFCNVHFGNSDLFSDLHLKELMELCSQREVTPIIMGDFNNFNLGAYKTTLLKNYAISTDITRYTSMPKDNGTLDYIAVPANTYLIKDVVCPEDYISDHRIVFANLEAKK